MKPRRGTTFGLASIAVIWIAAGLGCSPRPPMDPTEMISQAGAVAEGLGHRQECYEGRVESLRYPVDQKHIHTWYVLLQPVHCANEYPLRIDFPLGNVDSASWFVEPLELGEGQKQMYDRVLKVARDCWPELKTTDEIIVGAEELREIIVMQLDTPSWFRSQGPGPHGSYWATVDKQSMEFIEPGAADCHPEAERPGT